MQKRWIYKKLPEKSDVERLCKEINVSAPIASILLQRGIGDFESAKKFFRPSLKDLHDPFLMKDMPIAVDLLYKKIQNNEKILIYGDYDVDGTTSVALLFQYLSNFSENLEYYIPDRYSEGYGVSEKGMAYAIANNFSLIITIDCGIKAVDTLAKATKAGIDVIVCDHHLPGSSLPPVAAILDPKQDDCKYPYKELSGCGIGFKLLQGFYQKYDTELNPFDYLEFVAVSIAADIVPITGENRILAYHGIKKLNDCPSPGLKALLEISSRRLPLDISGIVFGLAPRINAAGRIKHAHSAVKLLIATSSEEAMQYASKINIKNDDRRKVDAMITEEALSMIMTNSKMQLAKSTVLYKQDWHKGVIGIVASRCIEKFYRPTIILTESNKKATGSARSVPGFDVYKAIEECSDLLEQFGGHTHAAGITMDVANVPLFQQRFEEVVAKNISEDLLVPPVEVDIEINPDQITSKFFNVLCQMGPFGPENQSPQFVTRDVKASNIKIIKEKHIKFTVTKTGQSNKFGAIAYNLADKDYLIRGAQAFDIAYSLEVNEYRGLKSIQLVVKDIKSKKR